MTNDLHPEILIRQRPDALCPALRYQVGRMESRPSALAHYDRRQFVGLRLGPPVTVFRLLGYGSTLKNAKARAARALVS